MKFKSFLLVNVFFVLMCSTDASVIDLPTIAQNLAYQITVCDDENDDKKDMLLIHKAACDYVIQNSNRKIPNSFLYKLECARVLATFEYGFFQKHVKPYLSGWIALKVTGVERLSDYVIKDSLNVWSGMFVYYKTLARLFQQYAKVPVVKGLCNNNKWDHCDLVMMNMPCGRADDQYCIKQYFSESELVLFDKRRNVVVERLLTSPQDGLLFCCGAYYGKIDFSCKMAVLYNVLNDKKMFLFAHLIPWAELIKSNEHLKNIQVLFNKNDLFCIRVQTIVKEVPVTKTIYYNIARSFVSHESYL